MKCSDPRSASDHDANLLIVGPAGVGKTNLRSAMMDRYVAAGLAPKGRAVITWTDLGPALTAPDPTRAQVRVTLNGEQRYFKLTELVSELKGCVLGIEEIGKAAPMRRRTPEQEQRLENLCTFMLTYTDHAGPLVADGYDVTGIPLANQGIERRFSTVTLIEPDQSAVQRAIAKR